MTEQELILQLQNGNKQAFEQLVREQQVRVINVAHSLLHCREDAEELAQDVFVEIHRSIANFRNESKLNTWIYRITINKALNFRRNKRFSLFFRLDQLMRDGGLVLEDAAPNPEMTLINNDRSVVLYKAIDSLPEKQRIAFTLQKYENLSQDEIAEIMKTSVSAVESHLFRAKKELQKKLLRQL